MRVALCIYSRIYREGLSHLLAGRVEVRGVVSSSPADMARDLVSAEYDIVLVDGAVPPLASPADVVRAVSRVAGRRPVVVLGLEPDDRQMLALVEAGAAAVIDRGDSLEELLCAMQAALAGELLCGPRVARLMQERLAELTHPGVPSGGLGKLSQRELHILQFIRRNMSNKQIARQLSLEVSTIKNHVHNIIVKLNVRNRAAAAAVAGDAPEPNPVQASPAG